MLYTVLMVVTSPKVPWRGPFVFMQRVGTTWCLPHALFPEHSKEAAASLVEPYLRRPKMSPSWSQAYMFHFGDAQDLTGTFYVCTVPKVPEVPDGGFYLLPLTGRVPVSEASRHILESFWPSQKEGARYVLPLVGEPNPTSEWEHRVLLFRQEDGLWTLPTGLWKGLRSPGLGPCLIHTVGFLSSRPLLAQKWEIVMDTEDLISLAQATYDRERYVQAQCFFKRDLWDLDLTEDTWRILTEVAS